MLDFTIQTYKELLNALLRAGYRLQTLERYMETPAERAVVLRHDVDQLPSNALRFARIQAEHGIAGSYYFRVAPESYDVSIMEQIAELGHEIGYHYEDVDLVVKRKKKTLTREELIDLAYESFCDHLEQMRAHFDVKTVCMHGSPRSLYDNRIIWTRYDYRERGVIGEPYFDVDFNKVAYYTDTGRRWDGQAVSVRDKVQREESEHDSAQTASPSNHFPEFNTTKDMIWAIENDNFPQQAMLTFHPQRWSDAPLPWLRELLWQNVKNGVKYLLIRSKR